MNEFRATDAFTVFLVWLLGFLALPFVFKSAGVPAIVATAALLPAAVVAGAALRGKSAARVLAPGRVSTRYIYWTLVGTIGLSLVLLSLSEPLVQIFRRVGLDPTSELEKLEENIGRLKPAWAWLLLAGLVPVAEESFFRGALLRGFQGSWGKGAAVFGSALLFGLFHLLPIRILVTFILGLWFGALALRTGGLAMPVAAHMANNALVLGLSAAGIEGVPAAAGVLGGAAAAIAAWRLFRVQGSEASAAS